MPKKTRPGGRYTKSVRRDGSQTYGRRGCLVMIVMMLAVEVAAGWGFVSWVVG